MGGTRFRRKKPAKIIPFDKTKRVGRPGERFRPGPKGQVIRPVSFQKLPTPRTFGPGATALTAAGMVMTLWGLYKNPLHPKRDVSPPGPLTPGELKNMQPRKTKYY